MPEKIDGTSCEVGTQMSRRMFRGVGKIPDEDGNKDFAQVLYIQRGKIKKITPWNSPFYDEYIEAYREMFPEDEEELCQDLLEDWDFYNSDEEDDI